MFYAGMSTQEHDLQKKREVAGRGRGKALRKQIKERGRQGKLWQETT